MQLLLSFANEESSAWAEPSPNVWPTLNAKQRNETLAVLARLLSKAAAASTVPVSNKERKEQRDD
jgi:hypothetical protein